MMRQHDKTQKYCKKYNLCYTKSKDNQKIIVQFQGGTHEQ